MRIIAGQYKGRRLFTPEDSRIRPTSDKVREAVFSILGEAVQGARVLDLFCGTGALGLEALSRGAASLVLVDTSIKSLALARRNLELVGAKAPLVKAELPGQLKRAVEAGPYDLIFLDPPYRKDLLLPCLEGLVTLGLLAPGATVAAEHEPGLPLAPSHLGSPNLRTWGDTAFSFFFVPAQGVAP
jgi:16S rRNA (guanine(966)-N(2))-methyltransferase RsmD